MAGYIVLALLCYTQYNWLIVEIVSIQYSAFLFPQQTS